MKRLGLLALLASSMLSAQTIRSFRTFDKDSQEWKNVVDYTQDDRIAFSFDSKQDIFAQYSLELFDYDWQFPSPMSPIQYANMYQGIPTYPQVIVSGFSDYTQYNGFFPDFGGEIKHSGNYRLVFSDLVSMDTLAVQDVFVVDPIFDVSIKGFNFNNVNLYTTSIWEVNVDLKGAQNVRYDSGDWRLAMVENYDTDHITYIDEPTHHQYQKWVYSIPNPVKADRDIILQLDTDRYPKRIAKKKRVIDVPIFYPELAALNNIQRPGSFTVTDLTPSPEYVFFDFKVDLSKVERKETDTVYLTTMSDRQKLSTYPLEVLDKDNQVYGRYLSLKEGLYNLKIVDKKGNSILKIAPQRNVQTSVFQFFLYYKAHGTLNYEILGYKMLSI